MDKSKSKNAKTVGIRELKAGLSRYLKQVKAGERIIVTEHNREIAAIVPMGLDEGEERLFRLVKEGLVDWSGHKPEGIAKRIESKGKSVSDAVLEDRR
ncbi:type II toxin-antitoxin system Phd/YefM family antitoxin [Acidobacteriota bacterium]